MYACVGTYTRVCVLCIVEENTTEVCHRSVDRKRPKKRFFPFPFSRSSSSSSSSSLFRLYILERISSYRYSSSVKIIATSLSASILFRRQRFRPDDSVLPRFLVRLASVPPSCRHVQVPIILSGSITHPDTTARSFEFARTTRRVHVLVFLAFSSSVP